jgi:hypothetical protein
MQLFPLSELDEFASDFRLSIHGVESIRFTDSDDGCAPFAVDIIDFISGAIIGTMTLYVLNLSDFNGDEEDIIDSGAVAGYENESAELYDLFFDEDGLVYDDLNIDASSYCAIHIRDIYLDPSVRGRKGFTRRCVQLVLDRFYPLCDFVAIKLVPFELVDDPKNKTLKNRNIVPLRDIVDEVEFLNVSDKLFGFFSSLGFVPHPDDSQWMYFTQSSLMAQNLVDFARSQMGDDSFAEGMEAFLSGDSPDEDMSEEDVALRESASAGANLPLFSLNDVLGLMRSAFVFGADELNRLRQQTDGDPLELLLNNLDLTSFGQQVETHFVSLMNSVLSGNGPGDRPSKGEPVH